MAEARTIASKTAERSIRRVALVGCGLIGAGWAARCLARGYEVIASDPEPDAEARLRAAVDAAWPALSHLTLAPGAERPSLTFTEDLEAAVADADFVQESAPEREALKRALLARIDAAARPEVPIASSSSGLLASRLQADCARPERILIGHPFNPVYLLPLVELVPGARSDRAVLARAAEFYRSLGMHPLVVRRELPGHIADRLQGALQREALHLIAEGVANTEEIDTAVAYGPGLRWAIMGPCLTAHLAGGAGGMAHFLSWFGEVMQQPWARFAAPILTDELKAALIEGTRQQAGGRTVAELAALRDDCLIGILRLLRQHDIASGRALAEDEARLYARRTFRHWQPGAAVEAPLQLYDATVQPEWLDYNGHMSESCYLLAFGDASDALFRYIGIDEAYRNAGKSFYTVETHMNNYREARGGELLHFSTRVLDLDPKRLHIFHAMLHGRDGALLATAEQLLLHVDMRQARTAPIEPQVYAALQAIKAAHEALPRPEQAGRRIAIQRRG